MEFHCVLTGLCTLDKAFEVHSFIRRCATMPSRYSDELSVLVSPVKGQYNMHNGLKPRGRTPVRVDGQE